MIRCRGCNKVIDFVALKSGRKMPIESSEPEEYRVHLENPAVAGRRAKRLVLVVNGEVLTVWQEIEELGEGRVRLVDGPCKIVGVESHFARCPNAADFRR